MRIKKVPDVKRRREGGRKQNSAPYREEKSRNPHGSRVIARGGERVNTGHPLF